jgi:hypothetical protein
MRPQLGTNSAPPIQTTARQNCRREPRYPYEFSIEVSGFDCAGQFFVEQTSTVDASFCGCRFPLRAAMQKAAIVAIRLLNGRNKSEMDRPTLLFRIANAQQAGRGWTVGVWRLQSSGAWAVQFPDAAALPNFDF